MNAGHFGHPHARHPHHPGHAPPPGFAFVPPPAAPHYAPRTALPLDPPGSFIRFAPGIAAGGLTAGVLSVVPIIGGFTQLLLFVGTFAGIALGYAVHFGSRKNDGVTSAEGVAFGAATGTVAGLVSLGIKLVAGAVLLSYLGSPRAGSGEMTSLLLTVCGGIAALSTLFGALYGWVALTGFH